MEVKKQYYYTISRAKANIDLYHDGEKENTISVWLTELDETLDELEAEGYTEGYLREEVITARKNYLGMRENMIQKKGLWIYTTDERFNDYSLCVTAFDPVMDAGWIEDSIEKVIGYASNRKEAWDLLSPYINEDRITCDECDLEDIDDSAPLKKYPKGYSRGFLMEYVKRYWPE